MASTELAVICSGIGVAYERAASAGRQKHRLRRRLTEHGVVAREGGRASAPGVARRGAAGAQRR
jgi:hypothetical protein